MSARSSVNLGMILLVIGSVLVGALFSVSGESADERLLPQAAGIQAIHRAGQTFVTWQEVEPPLASALSMSQLEALTRELAGSSRITYRVYHARRPIGDLAEAELIGEVPPLSGWNRDQYGRNPASDAPASRFVIDDSGDPVPPGTGLFVYNPAEAGPAYYAVTVAIDGAENLTLTPGAVTTGVTMESIGPGTPVLQGTERPQLFHYIEGATVRRYVRWESDPRSNQAGQAIDYLVAVPRDLREPAPVGIHLHGWGSSMYEGYGWWFNAEKGAVLVASNEVPYDWWTGYHELLGRQPLDTADQWRRGVVRPYSQRRLLSFVDWLSTQMRIDPARMFVAGNSMGGSGAIMMAIRYPEQFAWALSWVGVHRPAGTPQYKSSYELVYGKPEWNVRFEDGTPVWDYYDDVWYLRQHPGQDVGFISFSNGKNDTGIGWEQAVEFLQALQETRQPHLFVWGQDGHGQRALMPAGGGERVMPLDLRVDQSLPALTRSSLDDDVGNGSPASGAPAGQVNRYLSWRPDTIVDEPSRWGVTIEVIEGARASTGTVDVTPRRLQRFKPQPGERVEWTNSAGRQIVQQGEVVADQFGLVTLPQVRVSRGGNQIRISRQ